MSIFRPDGQILCDRNSDEAQATKSLAVAGSATAERRRAIPIGSILPNQSPSPYMGNDLFSGLYFAGFLCSDLPDLLAGQLHTTRCELLSAKYAVTAHSDYRSDLPADPRRAWGVGLLRHS